MDVLDTNVVDKFGEEVREGCRSGRRCCVRLSEGIPVSTVDVGQCVRERVLALSAKLPRLRLRSGVQCVGVFWFKQRF